MEVRCEIRYEFDYPTTATIWRISLLKNQNDRTISSAASAAALLLMPERGADPHGFVRFSFFLLLFTFINFSDPNIFAKHKFTRF